MAKIKFNIKNTQLADALKSKKGTATVEPSSSKAKKSAASAEKPEPKKPQTRIRQDESLLGEPIEKPVAIKVEKEPEPAIKRKARIMKEAPSTETPIIKEPQESIAPIEEPSSSLEKIEEIKPVEPEVLVSEPKETLPTAQVEEKPAEPSRAPLPSSIPTKAKELKPALKKKEDARFDSRDRQGLRDADNEAWRKRRHHKPAKKFIQEEAIIRPKELKVRLPITIKDLAQEMKLKASELIAKLFMKGVIKTLNDILDDETTIQLLGQDFDCEITIDTSEEERIRITGQSIRQEIEQTPGENLILRCPIVAFMGHVDHGKTSLIDYIRKSNRASMEAGLITQHIGAFKVHTAAGDVTILDTPGHEAFSEMRSRGANVTDIVILVIAGDEGIRAQTDEAIRQAREANVPILVALNKCDKPNFDEQKVYRELADRELLPESWGGTVITVNCSATTGKGIAELLEMIALQAEILELKANPNFRARGTILESEMHKGLGPVATVLVQNGTLKKGDAFVFGSQFGRIKTMQNDLGQHLETAGPSIPVKITGLSDLALAGFEFIVVKNEKEAKELATARAEGERRIAQSAVKLSSLDKMMAKKESGELKILPVILRADVQGSLEALKNSLLKIKSKKVRLEIVNAGVGEISESDIELAAASKATIVGFHTNIAPHATDLLKVKKVSVCTQDIIYHLVDEVKEKMKELLDKIEQENDLGLASVKTVFKSSQLGMIAGCQISEGVIKRQNLIRQIRNGEVIWKGRIASLKRMKEDVKEVKEGFECGILLDGQSDIREGDQLQAYEITYLEQEL